MHTHIYMYIYLYTNFIKHNRHFLSTYFLLDLFIFSYCFYHIQRELIYVLSLVVCIPSSFCPTFGHHQGRIYYKSHVTFVFVYYYCVRASLLLHRIHGNTNGSRRKYIDRKYLLCLMKFVLTKKCCQNIHIFIHTYIYIYIHIYICMYV